MQNPYLEILDASKKISTSKGIYALPGEIFSEKGHSFSEEKLILKAKDYEFKKSLFIEAFTSRISIDAIHQKINPPDEKWIETYFERIGEKLFSRLKKMPNKEIYSKYKNLFILNSGKTILLINQNTMEIKNLGKEDFFERVNVKYSGYWLSMSISPLILLEISKKSFHINEADAGGLISYQREGPYFPDLYNILFSSF